MHMPIRMSRHMSAHMFAHTIAGELRAIVCRSTCVSTPTCCILRSPPPRRRAAMAERFFSNISEHANGERRGPVSIWRCLKTHLTETFPMLPSVLIYSLSARRRHAPIFFKK